MKITTKLAAATVAAAGAVSIGAPTASADDAAATTYKIGDQAKVADGAVVQGWTVSDLRTSTDAIPYQVRGTLWEATATDEALQGAVIPMVSNLNARAEDGQTYRALFQVASPAGINPATLAPGQQTTGKVYFDVTGESPDSVVYNAGGRDLIVWVQPEPSQGQAESPAAPAPARSPATSAPAASPAAPAPAGSQGTPLPAGSQGTPLPASTEGTPLPVGSQGTPLPTGADPALAPVGSQGTPLPDAPHGTPVPTTTPVPAPAISHGPPAS